jgi:uroporphyrinogen III methyltransferase/synthase
VRAALDADYVTFTASSTVRRLVDLLGADAPARLSGARLVSIGPITSAAARDAGLTVHAEASRHDIPGLVDALVADAAAPR